MPSAALESFHGNLADVDRLLEIHGALTGPGPGRRHQVEVLNKSAVVLLTAIWEAFCEDLASECVAHFVAHATSAQSLSKDLRKLIAKEIKNDKDELASWNLAGDGWRDLLRERQAAMKVDRDRKLNTPKTAQIDDLFHQSLGIKNVSAFWTWPKMTKETAAKKLDGFVTLRGEIAHRAQAASGVRKRDVTSGRNHISRLVEKTEQAIQAEAMSIARKTLG